MSSSPSQWFFPISALKQTPSSSFKTLKDELITRAKGIEFLFRVGATLCLPLTASLSAAVFLHRFYMRYSLDDYHHFEIAAACIFLTTKTEESGRKLRDVANVCLNKANSNASAASEQENAHQRRTWENVILTYEETLLEALCFDFVVHHPHTFIVDLSEDCEQEARALPDQVLQFCWSIANDSLRTPLCLLFPPNIIAAACVILAEKAHEGSNSPTLDDRITFPSRWKSILHISEDDAQSIADAVTILLDFYHTQLPSKDASSDPRPLAAIQPPITLASLCTAASFVPGGPDALYGGGSDGGDTPASVIKTPKTPLRAMVIEPSGPETEAYIL